MRSMPFCSPLSRALVTGCLWALAACGAASSEAAPVEGAGPAADLASPAKLGGAAAPTPAVVASTPVGARAAPSAEADAAPPALLLGGAYDVHNAFPSVGALLNLQVNGEIHDACSATLIAPDVLLTAAHCVNEALAPDGFWRPSPASGRTLWVGEEKPLPLGRHPTYEVVGAIVHPGYTGEGQAVVPLYLREPHSLAEYEALQAFEHACGDPLQLFDAQARLRCLTELPAKLQRALGVADATHNNNDVALMFLAEAVRHIEPTPVAEALALPPAMHPGLREAARTLAGAWGLGQPTFSEGAAPALAIVGYGLTSTTPSWR